MDSTSKGYSDYGPDASGNLTADQVNAAFRQVYGIDAPDKVVQDFAGHVGGRDTSFLQRVQKGDFNAELQQKNPDYLQRSAYAIANRQQQEAIRPAIESYQASIPETQQRFQTERERLSGEGARLEDRYKALIDDIKRNQTVSETRQTRATGAELARRGISQDSGVYGQELTDALNPITSEYTSQIKNTGLSREDMLAKIRDSITGLTGGETDAIRAVRNAIAQLQAGAGQAAIAQGYQTIRDKVNDAFQQGQLSLQQANQILAQKQQELAQQQFNQISLPESQLQQQAAQVALNKQKYSAPASSSNPYQTYGNVQNNLNNKSGWS